MTASEAKQLKHAGSLPVVAVEFPENASKALHALYPRHKPGDYFPAVIDSWCRMTPLRLPECKGGEAWAENEIELYPRSYNIVK